MKYLAVSNQCWAKAPSIATAKRLLKQEGGDPTKCAIYECPDDYYIDELGQGHGSAPAKLIFGEDQRKQD
jgi:hypothetical protein